MLGPVEGPPTDSQSRRAHMASGLDEPCRFVLGLLLSNDCDRSTWDCAFENLVASCNLHKRDLDHAVKEIWEAYFQRVPPELEFYNEPCSAEFKRFLTRCVNEKVDLACERMVGAGVPPQIARTIVRARPGVHWTVIPTPEKQ